MLCVHACMHACQCRFGLHSTIAMPTPASPRLDYISYLSFFPNFTQWPRTRCFCSSTRALSLARASSNQGSFPKSRSRKTKTVDCRSSLYVSVCACVRACAIDLMGGKVVRGRSRGQSTRISVRPSVSQSVIEGQVNTKQIGASHALPAG
jgi:hypothetical protein